MSEALNVLKLNELLSVSKNNSSVVYFYRICNKLSVSSLAVMLNGHGYALNHFLTIILFMMLSLP